jgi:MoxR-like ATPase
MEKVQSVTEQVLSQLEQVVVGQRTNLRLLWTGLLAGGHVLLEGVPGLGKTVMVRSLAQVISGEHARIQFTPDLMPSDVIGTKVYDLQSGRFTYRRGPIFTNILLADEINRTPPKTQAALLEAMEERQVTIDGETFPLPPLFFVVATQNPVEYEGTYLLPEAQLDRFSMKLIIDYPDQEEEMKLLSTHSFFDQKEKRLSPVIPMEEIFTLREEIEKVSVESSVLQYLLQIIRATRNHPKVSLGASPRAALSTLALCKAEAAIQGRTFVIPDDVKKMIKPALRHRIVLKPDGELEGWTTDDIVEEIIQKTLVPR